MKQRYHLCFFSQAYNRWMNDLVSGDRNLNDVDCRTKQKVSGGGKTISEANMSLPADQRSASVKIHEVQFLRSNWTALQCNVLSFEINKDWNLQFEKLIKTVIRYTFFNISIARCPIPTSLPLFTVAESRQN